MVPTEPSTDAGINQPSEEDKNYLFDALIQRVKQTPQRSLRWHLIVTLGQPGDPTNDATLAWPDDREQVNVGTLTIDHIESEETGACRDINYDPLVLPSGIAPSDDPLLSARSAAYSHQLGGATVKLRHPVQSLQLR